MSRICVKSLPKYITEERLRDVFSQKGEITDAKLMRTKDGKSRQFAFIGFRTEWEAQEAIKYFNKSYLDTSRITCEIARKVGDPNAPRPWSRYSSRKQEKTTENSQKAGKQTSSVSDAKGEKKKSRQPNEIDDPQLQEFLQVMQPRVKSRLWENDMLTTSTTNQNEKVNKEAVSTEESVKRIITTDVEPTKAETVLNEHGGEQSGDPTRDEGISDIDYFKSKIRKDWSDSDTDGDADNDGNNSEEDDDDDVDDDRGGGAGDGHIIKDQQHHDGNNDVIEDVEKTGEDIGGRSLVGGDQSASAKDDKVDVLETGRLFVRNLPYSATEDDLQEHFCKYGDLSEVHVVVDKETKRSKGIAYILYTVPESAARALEELDNSIFQGRLLHVLPAKLKESDKPVTEASSQSKTFKERREEERKASEIGGDTKAWNSLFMRPDAVIENIARRYGVSKSDLLDRESGDNAVRVALGETQVVAETKKALANAGVNVASLEAFAAGKTSGMKRSNHVLLVKNLPYSSSEHELTKMFGKFGSLDKVILPSTRTMALVVFLEPGEARAAFKGLAYKRYKDAPLYLEWAPGNILDQNTSENSGKSDVAVGQHDVKRMILEQQVEKIEEADIDPDRIESRSLFVKNLNFKTSGESLKGHFNEHMKEGKIQSVRIKKHVKDGKNVSMGFGFIELDSVETATNICRDLQGTILDGHALILQPCHVKKREQVGKDTEKDKSSTKLLVRNIAFEAIEKDLRQLFSPFGQIKSLRLPMRFDRHRGFAFVEFVTKQEAQNAYQALSSTHLYGRHLVIERAKEGESLEELRARTATQFTDEQNAYQNPTKVSKKRKHMAVLDEGRMKFERIAE